MKGLHKVFLVILLGAGLLAGGLQIPVVMAQKDRAHDKQIVENLARISTAVEASRNDNNGKLPKSLAEANAPEELRGYKYSLLVNGVSYQLCAAFKTDTSNSEKAPSSEVLPYYGAGPDTSSHDAGEQCFTYTVSPNITLDDHDDPLGFSSNSSFYNDTRTESDDAELRANVDVIAVQLESYFAKEEAYPAASYLNDQAWREANEMKLLNSSVLSDGNLKSDYIYVAGTGVCGYGDSREAKCETFTLSVKLSDGTTYTRKSIN